MPANPDKTELNRSVVDRLKKPGRSGPPYGIFIASTDPSTTEIAASAGYDFVLIDGEHGPLDRLSVLAHVRAAEAAGVVPLVRGLDGSGTMIGAMLDVGVAGVVVPKLETADEARRVVAASRYAPEGTRGMCPSCHDGRYTLKTFSAHMKSRNRDAMVIPIIETQRGVQNIESIVAVDGMDIIHFGPGDLSADMGIDLTTDAHKLKDAWERVRDAARAAGKWTLVPDGFHFEGADSYIGAMELLELQVLLTEKVATFRASHKGDTSVRAVSDT